MILESSCGGDHILWRRVKTVGIYTSSKLLEYIYIYEEQKRVEHAGI